MNDPNIFDALLLIKLRAIKNSLAKKLPVSPLGLAGLADEF